MAGHVWSDGTKFGCRRRRQRIDRRPRLFDLEMEVRASSRQRWGAGRRFDRGGSGAELDVLAGAGGARRPARSRLVFESNEIVAPISALVTRLVFCKQALGFFVGELFDLGEDFGELFVVGR